MRTTHDDRGSTRLVVNSFALVLALWFPVTASAQMDNETCLGCHEDAELTTSDGRSAGVSADGFAASVHGALGCVDCHAQTGDYETTPHYDRYEPVDCARCHAGSVASHRQNFHFKARADGNRNAPRCVDCHATAGDPHRLHGLGDAVAEESCRRCHQAETDLYDAGVHAARPGASTSRPGCVTCHQSHGPGLPPAAGAVSNLCESCHRGAMADVERGGHANLGGQDQGALNCASCHDVHGTHRPHMSSRVAQACTACHAAERAEFAGSVHADLLESGELNCLSCHSTHKDEEAVGRFDGGCGSCHDDVEQTYRSSVHRFGRLHGNEGAATCANCHQGHHVLAAGDPAAPIHPTNIPAMCGQCHGEETVVAANFVRLPITLAQYQESVHGKADKTQIHAATCTDCHGVHDLQHAQHAESSINHFNLSRTCGKCHSAVADQYQNSIHGQAVAIGIADAPTCNDCHDEHLIRSPDDPQALTTPNQVSRKLCGSCHTDPEMAAKYGITAGVVESYLDSYHGWAVDRGGTLVATCVDCHTVHDIRSPLDPASSIHQEHVTDTCGKCHERSNETFARSYTHASALAARGPHEWAKLIYLVLIGVVLGGMALHNLIVARYELRKHRARRRSEDYVVRWIKAERIQHIVLLTSFTGLAVTGFALRMPDAWWVHLLGLSGNEALRATLHRALAIILTVASFYHVGWILLTRRGRMNIRQIVPKGSDFLHFPQNMLFHLGLRRERPHFHRFDYTQKAEYWAVIWGTVVMALTGAILWFPDLVTGWLPAWAVRVSEVVHYYEAILAVSAIVIWHLFYVVFMPSEYPMSTIWLDGRLPAHEWKTMHPAEFAQEGESAVRKPGDESPV
ncbi:MAG TPA: cytochrome c3 family protein [Candidatus Krumholzibacteria bacterium]|nr:cytochrome c3 family protein [Candidatus Krumholzibacteria bacterium]HPD72499.1 cytochrome c3 family protein [Candidatus Krumholzibacteria bacterium]HRY40569.1 cytochrome c3 family protein [Candidatus Krumholzibacteria bacterium]